MQDYLETRDIPGGGRACPDCAVAWGQRHLQGCVLYGRTWMDTAAEQEMLEQRESWDDG